jgi:hypothetical protein
MSVFCLLCQKRETHEIFSSGVSMIDGGCGSKEHAGSYDPRNVGEVTGRVIYRAYGSELSIRDRYRPSIYPMLVVIPFERRIRYAEWSKI